MPTFGSADKNSVPTSFAFSYDGEVTTWGSYLYSIADITNQADPVDNKLRISDMKVSFIDTDKSIWGSLGNGTSAFNKVISGTVFVGGSVGPVTDYLGVRYKKINAVGAYANAFFTGKVREVSKRDNIVSISAQNLMNLLPLVEWQLPVNDYDPFTQGSFYKGYSFCVEKSVLDITWGSLVAHAGFNKEDSDNSADFYAYTTASGIPVGYSTGVTGIYDISAGTGIEDTLLTPDHFLNDAFYRDYKPLKFRGTLLGIKRGTISEGTVAQEFGYANLAESEAHVGVDGEGTYYTVNKMRFEWPSGTADSTLPNINYRAMYRMAGDPAAVLRHLLFGKMVTSYYDQTLNMGTETFYEAARVSAFKFYEQTINPDDKTVLPYINDLLSTESALFYVSSRNQFNFEPYGPKNLLAVLESIGTVEIIESEYSNDINDAYNHVILKYGYNFERNTFTKETYGTLAAWDVTNDVPLELSSHWLQNPNQAALTVTRQLTRYKKTSPKASFTTSLKYSQMEIGSLVKVSDPDSGMADKTIQILDYSKGFGNANQITFSGYDGEALFLQRGYAFWEGDTGMNEPVSGTSTSGWGTNGTVHGINTAIFGTQFVWW